MGGYVVDFDSMGELLGAGPALTKEEARRYLPREEFSEAKNYYKDILTGSSRSGAQQLC